MKVIILAGGKGTRLPVSAKNIPKPLVRINEKTLLDYQIALLEKHGFSDIRFSLGYMADKIINYLKANYSNRYEWVVEEDRLGTGGALKLASQDLKEDFLAFNVDDFPKLDYQSFVNFHNNHEIENTIAIYKIDDARDFGLVKHQEGLIEEFLEKPKEQVGGWINTGFYVLSPDVFDNFPQTSFSIEKDVFPHLAKKGKLACYQEIEHWFTTGTEERLRKAADFLINLFD